MESSIIFLAAEVSRDMFIRNRTKHIIRLKAMIIAYLYDECNYNFPHIAKMLDCHHTTIINLYYQAEDLKEEFPYLAEWYKHLDARYKQKQFIGLRIYDRRNDSHG